MASVFYNPNIDHFKGSIGKLTFSGKPGKCVVRSKPIPPTSMLARAISVRGIMQIVAYTWRDLTATAYNAWKLYFDTYGYPVYSRGGVVVAMTLFQAFIHYQLLRYQGTSSVLLYSNFVRWGGPTNPVPTIATSAGVTYLTFNSSVNTHWYIMYYFSGFDANLQKIPNKKIYYAGCSLLNITFINVSAFFTNRFGSVPATGNYLKCKVVCFGVTQPDIGFVSGVFNLTVG